MKKTMGHIQRVMAEKINMSVGSFEKNGVVAGLGVSSSNETPTTCMSHQLQLKIDGV